MLAESISPRCTPYLHTTTPPHIQINIKETDLEKTKSSVDKNCPGSRETASAPPHGGHPRSLARPPARSRRSRRVLPSSYRQVERRPTCLFPRWQKKPPRTLRRGLRATWGRLPGISQTPRAGRAGGARKSTRQAKAEQARLNFDKEHGGPQTRHQAHGRKANGGLTHLS